MLRFGAGLMTFEQEYLYLFIKKNIRFFKISTNENGVVYFSLGSYVKTTDIPRDKLEAFVESRFVV